MDKIRRHLTPPAGSFFLFGPRGTGKSTWVRAAFPDALMVDLLRPDACRTFSARPERLLEVAAGSRRTTVVIDEVQKVPALLDVVHHLLEEGGDHAFVLTGSSSRKLRATGVDLLAGRAVLRSMHPFMASELASSFSLDSAVEVGLVPVVIDAATPADVLASYVALYVRQEVQAEGLVRRLGDFDRFLEIVSFSHAAQLNISNVARECGAGRKTVESWVGILEDLLVAFRIEPFSARARRALTTHPKFYLFDAGVFRSLRPSGPLDRPEEIEGAALEGLVAQHLRAWCSYTDRRDRLYFWRTRAGSEVDFVVYGPSGFWALEVKNGARARPEDLRPLRTFCDDYPECRPLMLHRGTERSLREGILCVGAEEFLRQLVPGRALDAGL